MPEFHSFIPHPDDNRCIVCGGRKTNALHMTFKTMDLERAGELRLEITLPSYGTDRHRDKHAERVQRILETSLHTQVKIRRIQ